MYSTVAPTFTFSQSLGVISALFFAEILPDPKGDEELILKNTSWRFIYGYWPGALTIYTVIAMMFLIDHEPVKFLIMQGRDEEAEHAIRKVYKHAKTPEMAQ